MTDYTLRLGPLSFRTTADHGPTEALGNAIEVVGAALTAADPAPKPFQLAVPVGWAGRDSDAHTQGLRARRQVRAFLNNTQARMQGLYFSWDVDPDLNGWLIVGGGDLEPGDPAGITTGEWKLTLRDCYVAGRRRTHRPAIQVQTADRRLATTPRDYLRTLYSSAFATSPTQSRAGLPIGAQDATTYGDAPILETVTTRDGTASVAFGLADGQAVSFEQAETWEGLGRVAIHDRRGSTAEADWEPIYGPDQELTAGDAPVIDNGYCRVRWDDGCLALDAWVSGTWLERGRVPVGTLVSAHVSEWTTERGVVAIVADDRGVRTRCYVTVQRGTLGPMVELYAASPVLRYVMARAGTVSFMQATSGTHAVASGSPLASGTIATFSGANWVELSDGSADTLAPLRSGAGTRRGSDSTVYGTARSYVELPSSDVTSAQFALAGAPGAFVLDTFATDTSVNYALTGSGIAIRGGLLTVSSTTQKTLIHTRSEGIDSAASIRVNIGASVASWLHRTVLRAADANNYLAAQISSTGALLVVKRSGGSDTVLATLAGANLSTGTSVWVVLRALSASVLTAELWTTDPAAGGTPARSITHTLSAGDQVLFPSGIGKGGMVLSAGGTDWTYDDLTITRHGTHSVRAGFDALTDTRVIPTLVART